MTGQTRSRHDECNDGLLKIYADSLRMLITRFQPKKVIQISDSLLQVHSDLVCPDIVRIKACRAYAYEHLFNFEAAIVIYNDILKVAVKNQFIEEEIIVRMSLARVYESIERPELCVQYLEEINKLFETYENKSLMSHYYVRASSYHRIYKDKDVAREYAHKAIRLGKKSGRIGSLAGGNLILGLLTDDFDESIEYLKKASQYCLEEGDYVTYIFQELNIARKYLKKNDFKHSLEAINSVVNEIKDLTENDKIYYQLKLYLSTIKAEAHEGLGEKDSLIIALKQINQYTTLFGEITNQEKINQLIVDNTVSQEKEKVKSAKKLNVFLFLGIISLFGIIILLSRLIMANKATNKKIGEQSLTITQQYGELQKLYNYQSTLLSEVHHRIKNNLQLIISLLILQKAKLTNSFEQKFLNDLSHRISSIALIHEHLYSLKEFEKVNVSQYSRGLLNNLMTLTPKKNVHITNKVDDIRLNLETTTPLGLIWSELVSNSLKYNGHDKELNIYIELFQSEDNYFMHYYDNGIGYPKGQFQDNNEGIGFTIIQSLSKQLAAQTSTYNSEGAHFTMEFKEKIISPL
ncbi:MAG: sensor histidine kinase [Saprospiraceae bacterium]